MREPFIAAYIDKGVWWSTYKCALWAILACGWPIRASDLLAGPPVTNDWKKTHLFFFSYLLLCFCGRPPIPKSMFIFGFPLMHCNDSPPLFARLHQGFDSFARDLWVIMFDGPDEICIYYFGRPHCNNRPSKARKSHKNPHQPICRLHNKKRPSASTLLYLRRIYCLNNFFRLLRPTKTHFWWASKLDRQRTNDGINLVMDGSTLGLFTTTFHDSVT